MNAIANLYSLRRLALAAVASLGLAGTATAAEIATDLEPYVPKKVEFPHGAPYVLADGTIMVTGSDAQPGITLKMQELFTKHHPEFRFTTILRGNTLATGGLAAKVSAYGPMGRNPRRPEIDIFLQEFGYEPSRIIIGYTHNPKKGEKRPPGFWVHAENPIEFVTTEQMARIFTTGDPAGDITHWRQLGVGGDWEQIAIHLFVPRDLTGDEAYLDFTRDVMGNRPISPRAQHLQMKDGEGMDAIIDIVARDQYAMALGRYYEPKNPKVKFLPVKGPNDAIPSDGSLQADVYAYAANSSVMFHKVPGKPLEPWLKEYLRMCLSKEGQQIVATAQGIGWRPLRNGEAAIELKKLEPSATTSYR